MNQTSNLLNTLKKYLKTKGISYKKLAQEMNLSEATVKRLFSKQTFTLKRLEEVCRTLDIDLYDLVQMDKHENRELSYLLTDDQEQALADDPKLLTFLYLLANGWTQSSIIEEFEISESEAVKMLGVLEHFKLIKAFPNSKSKILILKNIYWKRNGPLWNKYQTQVFNDFMNYPFSFPGDRLIFSPGQFSESSIKIIRKKIDELLNQYDELAELDNSLSPKDRFSSGLIIGFRPWNFSVFENLKRQKETSVSGS